jgi:hypothetical protein
MPVIGRSFEGLVDGSFKEGQRTSGLRSLRRTGAERRSVACQLSRPHVADITPRHAGRSTTSPPRSSPQPPGGCFLSAVASSVRPAARAAPLWSSRTPLEEHASLSRSRPRRSSNQRARVAAGIRSGRAMASSYAASASWGFHPPSRSPARDPGPDFSVASPWSWTQRG